jgi:hypothetical protein
MHDLIAGALFDFMGRLTTLEDPITLSSKHEPHRLLEVFTEWAAERRLNTHNADVQRWQFRIADDHTPTQAAVPGAAGQTGRDGQGEDVGR